jgi:hypothetical protein
MRELTNHGELAAALLRSVEGGHRDAALLGAYALFAAGVLASGCALRPRFGRDQYTEALESARATPPPGRPEPGLEPEPRPPARPGPGRRPRPGRVRRRLADPATWAAVAAAVGAAAAEAAPAWPYAVLLGPDTVTVRLAGAPGSDPGKLWRKVSGGWCVDLDQVTATRPHGQTDDAAISDGYVALGSYGRDLVLLDLDCAPGVMTVSGDRRAARELVSALVAQIEAVAGHRVLVARGALPDAPETGLSELLNGLDRPAAAARPAPGGGTPLVFLACADPTEGEALRLQQAVARHPRLRVLVLGALDGSQWSLTVAGDGWVTAAGLGLAAASSVLPSEVAERGAPSRVAPDPDRSPKEDRRAGPVPLAGSLPVQPERSVPSPGAPAFDSTITIPVRQISPPASPGPPAAPEPPHDDSAPGPPTPGAPAGIVRARVRSPAPGRPAPESSLERTLEVHRALAPLPERDPGPPARPLPAAPRATEPAAGLDDAVRERMNGAS